MTTTPRPARLTARSPEDILALAPVLIGFWPEESIVMLTFGASRPFHARTDLPPSALQRAEVRRGLDELLLGPARRHGVAAVALVYFTADRSAARGVHEVLARGCRRSGIGVVCGLVSDGERYVDLAGPDPGGPGHRYDVEDHPFVLDAVVSGRLTHRTRDQMVASLEADPERARRIAEEVLTSGLADAGVPVDGRSLRVEGRWVETLVSDAVRGGAPLDDRKVARLLWSMQALRVRDAAWSLIDREEAEGQARFWTEILHRAPEELAAAPAVLLAWSAWQAGDGARAWAALDRCERAAPGYALAEHLALLLQNAVPPDFWEGGFDWTLGLPPAV